MANSLNKELAGRVVVRDAQYMNPAYRDLNNRLFRAESGFGCFPFTRGNAVFGVYLLDNEEARIQGYEIERFATEEEVAAVLAIAPPLALPLLIANAQGVMVCPTCKHDPANRYGPKDENGWQGVCMCECHDISDRLEKQQVVSGEAS